MGQYHYIANLDRKEYIHPHRFGDGLKLLEFGSSGEGTMTGLAVLLAISNGRGGGDLTYWGGEGGKYGDGRDLNGGDPGEERANALLQHIVGRWAGERIAIVGDYHNEADAKRLGVETKLLEQLWGDEEGDWVDISSLVVETIELDHYLYTERHREFAYPSGHTTTRGGSYGGLETTAVLDLESGAVTRAEVSA